MFLLTISSALAAPEWVLYQTDSYEHNDDTRYNTSITNFRIANSGCYSGTYCAEKYATDDGNHIAFISNSSWFIEDKSDRDIKITAWIYTNGDGNGGLAFMIQDINNFFADTIAGQAGFTRTDFRKLIGGTPTYDNSPEFSIIVQNTWAFAETIIYSDNNTVQFSVYQNEINVSDDTYVSRYRTEIMTDFSSGFIGMMSFHYVFWDDLSYYRWEEPPTAGEPDAVKEADWISPSSTPQANNTSPFLLNWTASTDTESGSNLTYRVYINESLEKTTNNTHYTWTIPTEGTYILRVDVSEWNNLTRWVGGDNMTFTYDVTDPLITLNPNNFYSDNNDSFFTTAQANALLFNYTITDNHDVYAIQLNVVCPNGFSLQHNDTSLSGKIVVWNYTANLSTGHGVCNSTSTSWDSHTNEKIKDYKVKEEKDKITYDDKISIKSDETVSMWTWKEKDRYLWRIAYEPYAKKEKKITITGTDTLEYLPNSEFPGHFVDWNEKKWIDLNCSDLEGAEVPIKSIKKNKAGEYEATFDTESTGIVCHSIGGLNNFTKKNKFVINDVPIIIDVQALNPTNTSLNPIEGWANSTDPDNDTLTYYWQFLLNGTVAITGNTSGIAPNVFVQVANTTGTTLHAGENWTFQTRSFDGWNYTAWQNSSNSVYLETVTMNVCGGEFVYPIFNITYKNTQTGNSINASNVYALLIDDGITELSLTGSFTSNTTHSFCTPINPAFANYSWNVWGTFNLQSIPLLPKTISIAKLSPLTWSNNPTTLQEYQLIDGTNSSTVVITWTTDSYAIVDGTLRVYKCEPDGTRTLMDETPITGGTSTTNLNLYFTQYSYEVIIGSIAYQGSSYYTCHAENSESPSYQIVVDNVDTSEAIGLYFATCLLNKTANDTARMVWGANPASTEELLGCFRAKRLTATGWTLIYENCTSGLTGEIERTIPLGGNSYIVEGTLTQGDLTAQCTPTLEFHALTPAQSEFGNAILMGIVLLLMVLALVFENAFMKTVAVVAGLVGVWIVGLTAIGWITLSSIIAYLIIIYAISRGKKT